MLKLSKLIYSMLHKKLFFLGLAAFFVLASCNNNKEENSEVETPAATTEASADNTAASEKLEDRATINITLSGAGDMDGSYSAICRDACCSWGIAGDKVFGNQYSETGKGPKELSSVQLVVDDVEEGNKSTKEFMVTVSFGELFGKDSKSYNINTRDGRSEGSGNLELEYSGSKATVTIKGTSKEGATIDLKMECHKIINPNNLGM